MRGKPRPCVVQCQRIKRYRHQLSTTISLSCSQGLMASTAEQRKPCVYVCTSVDVHMHAICGSQTYVSVSPHHHCHDIHMSTKHAHVMVCISRLHPIPCQRWRGNLKLLPQTQRMFCLQFYVCCRCSIAESFYAVRCLHSSDAVA